MNDLAHAPEPPESPSPWPCTTVFGGRVHKCALPHCVKCGSHYDPGDHTDTPLCRACESWARFYLNAPGARAAFERLGRGRR